MTTIDVRLRAEWVKNVGYRYDVLLDGEVIVRRSRDPEYDTARVLHSRGLRGKFRTIDFRTGKPRMTFDIEKAARLCTVERTGRGPVVEVYRPLDAGALALLHGPPLYSARVIPGRTVQGTGDGPERDGDETAVLSRRVPEKV